MAQNHARPAPKGWLSVSDLEERWGSVVSVNAIRRWLRLERIEAATIPGDGRNRYMVSEAEAARWELEHPRLRALVEAREAQGGAA